MDPTTTTTHDEAIEEHSGDKRDPRPERAEFHITDEAGANWYARKLAGIEAERARVKAQAAKIIAQLDGDEKSLKDRFEAEAREWARQEIERRYKGRRKSLALLQGTFSFRAVPATLRIDDTAAALNTAATLGAVKVDASAYRSAAIEAMKMRGELLPGVVAVPERESFRLDFGRDSGDEEEPAAAGNANEPAE